ncbi:MAG: TonB-dependent receptor [Elusimicrobia bacterium]|nr:TonB-dependent receptor [Elusimicrobiota bacterium]
MRSSAVVAALAAAVSAAPAAQAATQNRMLQEIVVLGQKLSPIEETLTMREVRESPARDMSEALKRVEGISIVRKGAIANDVVLRGFQKDNINVLVDGMRLHGACPNRMDSPSFHYDFAEIEQVTVLKGPNDISNPGGLGGTVNALTKKPRPGWGGDFSLTNGSYDSLNASAVGSYGADRSDGLVGYAYKRSGVPRSGDHKPITDIYAPTSSNRYRSGGLDSTAYELNTGWAKLGFKPGADSRLDAGFSYQDAEHVLYPYLLMDAVYDRTQRADWSYRWAGPSTPDRDFKLQVYWNRVRHLMDDALRQSSIPSATVTRAYSMQTDATSQTLGLKLAGALPLGGGRLRGGLDYYQRDWDAVNRRAAYAAYTPLNMIPDAVVHDAGVFVEYTRGLPGEVTAKAGARGDFARAQTGSGNPVVAEGAHRDFQELSATVQITAIPAQGLELFAGLARGARLPDQKELFMSLPTAAKNTFGEPSLKATINDEADLGAKYASDRFYVKASLFYSSLMDYINLRGYTSGGVNNITYENVRATLWGGEFGSQISLPWDLYLNGNLSCAVGNNDTAGRPLSEVPPLKGSVALRYDKGAYFVEAEENFSARQYRVDSALQETQTPGSEITDLKVGYAYKALSIYAGVSNVFDRYYFSFLSYLRDPFASGVKVPENGRNFYGTLALRF